MNKLGNPNPKANTTKTELRMSELFLSNWNAFVDRVRLLHPLQMQKSNPSIMYGNKSVETTLVMRTEPNN